jgi:hypothetical protein
VLRGEKCNFLTETPWSGHGVRHEILNIWHENGALDDVGEKGGGGGRYAAGKSVGSKTGHFWWPRCKRQKGGGREINRQFLGRLSFFGESACFTALRLP